MGCGESRVKRISLTSDQDWETNTGSEKSSDTKVVTKQLHLVQELSVSALQPTFQEEEKDKNIKNVWEGLKSENVWEGLKSEAPSNRLLDSIPTSDLGESLDCRLGYRFKVTFYIFDCRPRRVVEQINTIECK